MITNDREWTRKSAEERIHDVLDRAKAGEAQTIHDPNGKFEIRFVSEEGKTPAGSLLAKGGPGGL